MGGGCSTFKSPNTLGVLIGIFLHFPVVVLSVLLFIVTFVKGNDMFGNNKLFKLNGTTWLRIIGIVVIVGAIVSPANYTRQFVRLTFCNGLWYLYMITYVLCLLLGTGGIKFTLTDDCPV